VPAVPDTSGAGAVIGSLVGAASRFTTPIFIWSNMLLDIFAWWIGGVCAGFFILMFAMMAGAERNVNNRWILYTLMFPAGLVLLVVYGCKIAVDELFSIFK
jgi:hypothetical protein